MRPSRATPELCPPAAPAPQPSRRSLLAGAGAALAAAGIATATLPALAKPHPDAALLAAWESYLHQIDLLDACDGTDEEADAIFMGSLEIADRLMVMPPQTLDGIRVKLRLALCQVAGS
jgi:hypothetical protein